MLPGCQAVVWTPPSSFSGMCCGPFLEKKTGTKAGSDLQKVPRYEMGQLKPRELPPVPLRQKPGALMRGTSPSTLTSCPCVIPLTWLQPHPDTSPQAAPTLQIPPSYKAHILCLAECPLGVSKALHLAGNGPLETL